MGNILRFSRHISKTAVTDKGPHDTSQRILQENMYNSHKGAWPGPRDLLLEFWDALHISVRDIATDVKFGMENGPKVPKQKNVKLGQKGRGLGHVTYVSNFGTTSVYLEWTKPDLKFVPGMTARGAKLNMQNWQ